MKSVLDGDIVIYRACAAAQEDWGDGDVMASLSGAQRAFNVILGKWSRELKCGSTTTEGYVLALTDSDNFRYDVTDTYKANRKDTERPLLLTKMREWAEKEFPCVSLPRLEADDIMGMYMSDPDDPYVTVTIDKDLQGVPGWSWNPDKQKKPTFVSKAKADLFWMRQTMIGDVTDGYKGAYRIGPAKAEKIIPRTESVERLWAKVYAAWPAKEKDEALPTARLARILRFGEYDYENKREVLWTPKGPPTS